MVLGLVVPLAAACDQDGDGSDGSAPAPTGPPADATSAPADDAPAGQALYFYPPVEGATLTYTSPDVTSEVAVDSVTSGNGGVVVTATETAAGDGGPVTVDRTFTTGPDGSLSIGASTFAAAAPGIEVTGTGPDVTFPSISALESGDTATGETFVEFTGPIIGGRSDVTYTVSGRGFESVTTPAGSAQAYVVELAMEVEHSTFGSVQGQMVFWFAPGFGLLRQEVDLEPTSTTIELTQSSVPLP